jgi:predicted nucleic acid-binding protein
VSVAYLDTSALLKQYVTEIGSDWMRAFLSSNTSATVFLSQLSVVEATCAFTRRVRDGTLTRDDRDRLVSAFDYDLTYRYHLLDVIPVTIETARRLATEHPLRAYDAVQLATAWLLNEELVETGRAPLMFICSDEQLVTIAQATGLNTENPNLHQ